MSLKLENTEKYIYILEKPKLLIKELTTQIKRINNNFNKIHPNLDKSEADQCTNFVLGGMEHLSFELADKIAELIRDYKQLLKWYLSNEEASALETALQKRQEEQKIEEKNFQEKKIIVEEKEENNVKEDKNIIKEEREKREDEEILVSDTGSSKYEVYSEPNENHGFEEENLEENEGDLGAVRELRYQRTDDEEEESEIEFEEVKPTFEQLESFGVEKEEAQKVKYDSEPKSENLMESLNKISEKLKKQIQERREVENNEEFENSNKNIFLIFFI